MKKPHFLNLKPILFFLVGVFFLTQSCNSSIAEENKYALADDFEKIKVSKEISAEELAKQEMVTSIEHLFGENYSLQTKARKILMTKYLEHEDFAKEISKVALEYLSKENDKFDQYNVALLLSKASKISIQNGRDAVRKYIMKIENKEYVGPKMSKNISIVKSKL